MSQPPPPYGAYQQESDRSNKLLGYLLGGLLIGPLLAVACPFLGLSIGSGISGATNDYSDTPLAIGVVAGLVAPLLIPVPLLFGRRTRPWGVGILLGAALTMIVLGGLCVGFIYLLTQSHA
ncbi:MAG TPA: hypothetical protein VNT31_05925 [Nocardioides sp.]|nr:hypothetical protein [Nocardioides sp.]